MLQQAFCNLKYRLLPACKLLSNSQQDLYSVRGVNYIIPVVNGHKPASRFGGRLNKSTGYCLKLFLYFQYWGVVPQITLLLSRPCFQRTMWNQINIGRWKLELCVEHRGLSCWDHKSRRGIFLSRPWWSLKCCWFVHPSPLNRLIHTKDTGEWTLSPNNDFDQSFFVCLWLMSASSDHVMIPKFSLKEKIKQHFSIQLQFSSKIGVMFFFSYPTLSIYWILVALLFPLRAV